MRFQVTGALKVRTQFGVRELQPGDVVAMPEDMALRLIEGGRVKPFSPDCFSPDGTLEAAFAEATADGWTDDQLLAYMDALRHAEALKSPWGFMVKDSPLAGDFWIISDATARERLPEGARSFGLSSRHAGCSRARRSLR